MDGSPRDEREQGVTSPQGPDAATERCFARSPVGSQCIYERGHEGDHFAKDSFAYYTWADETLTPDAARVPDCACGTGNVWGYPYGSGHSQGCPYRIAMAQRDAQRTVATCTAPKTTSAVHVAKVVRRRLRSNGDWNINDWKDVADALSRAVLELAGEDPYADA